MLEPQALFHHQTSSLRPQRKTSRSLCHVVNYAMLTHASSLLNTLNTTFRIVTRCLCDDMWSCSFKDTDGLISQSLLVGNFEGAVDLCLNDGRFAEAILLSISGGEELLKKTQQKYLSKQKNSISMVRLN